MLLRKGVFPYDYVDEESKLEERSLPSKENFYSRLSEEHISEEDFHFANKVWEKMNVKTLGEYSDIYLRMDVALLSDIFERFRDISLRDYQLDPCYYYTTPGLSWSAMLKKTGVVLDLITDIDMLLFIEKGLRGGVSSIFHRYAKANNPYLINDYDPSKETSYLGYFDANNLYGWAMSQHLTYGFFSWVNEGEDIEKLKNNIGSLTPNSNEGYILEVDLEYPPALHDEHSDFPLAPERQTIRTEDLSPYSRKMLEELLGKKTLGSCEKLVPNLHDKEKYVIHYRNLQLYLELGMRLKKVHRVLKFRQSPWLKTYIDFNTNKRKQATNEFEKMYYKLLNNSIFGRSLMNIRKHVNVKLCHTEKKFLKYTARPSFKSCTVFNEDLVAVENLRTDILMNQPVYVGFSILDLSKHLMYDFHYKHMKTLYGGKIRLCFTDTDSFLYHIQTEDMYDDMMEYQDMFDTSEYDEAHMLHSNHNKKVLGKFKDETKGVPISEFVGLRA
ncbi:uncharacterized protein [Mytilus edulis]|uniref:uncharacterized protein n=1 Tax=Mytilus edulis TaxID=6550 RepID=UPI0039EECD36